MTIQDRLTEARALVEKLREAERRAPIGASEGSEVRMMFDLVGLIADLLEYIADLEGRHRTGAAGFSRPGQFLTATEAQLLRDWVRKARGEG